MPRTRLMLIASLAAGVANGEPQQAGHTQQPEQVIAERDPYAGQPIPKHKKLEELLPDEATPELWIGSSAPALTLSHFARGEPITSFEPERFYVVEMWATWCGPCIEAFPHVAALQRKYADKLTVIGVNIWEQAKGNARVELIDEFVAKHPEMNYTVAIEEGTSMGDRWMKASGRNGIPTAFIIDGAGKVAWMGHPLAMDKPLDQILNGEYDVDAASQRMRRGHLTSVAYDQMLIAASKGESEWLLEVCKTLVYDAYSEGEQPLNAISWRLLGYEDPTPGILRVAYDAARKACELTDWKDWMILDTYALAAHKNGDHEGAIKWQKTAIEIAPEENKPELQPQLDLFMSEG